MTKVLLLSDLHLCHIDWYGMKTEDRMERLCADLCREYKREPYDLLLFLGDYSLDFWMWKPYGSYLTQGVSNTKKFMQTVIPALPPVPKVFCPGNHEQYGNEAWRELTGNPRQTSLLCGSFLFLFPDTFGGVLDPTEHSDGTYQPASLPFLREEMNRYPDKKVFLLAHHFDRGKEHGNLSEFVGDPRVLALFAGHDHLSHIEDFYGKPLLRTGNYSYSGDLKKTRWGWRELVFDEHTVSSRYVQPGQTLLTDGMTLVFPRECCDEWVLS